MTWSIEMLYDTYADHMYNYDIKYNVEFFIK